jgi:D-alanyl-D-alanine carboxypeptidase/D-alanyl-D-alanine-endopeptidase (penicillin-binding protein 4)
MSRLFILYMKNCFALSCIILLSACTATSIKRAVKKSEVFSQGYTGFALYDPVKGAMIYAQNEDHYFLPASSTKLFTFYTAQKILGDSISGLNYTEIGDSLIFWGTGDPSFLHPDLENNRVFDFLAESDKQLFYANNFYQVTPLGPGWSWDWYKFYYSTERSAFPLYGNVVRFRKELNDSLLTFSPAFFEQNIREDRSLDTESYRMALTREKTKNEYSFFIKDGDSLKFTLDIPFMTSDSLTVELLQDILERQVQLIDYEVVRHRPHLQLNATAPDSLYKRMLQNSDNFLAEQLLLLSSDKLLDSLSTAAIIDYSKKHFLADLPDEPVWGDGSGLSGQNMFTPRSIIKLLEKIKAEFPEDKLFQYLPAGGRSGTIKNWYKADKPYVYAKSGTLNNSTCLSGYLFTESGTVLLFSFMHNNYVIPSGKLKNEMEKVLYQIHKTY